MTELVAIIKVGKKANIDMLFELGRVHFRRVTYFREIEEQQILGHFRKDKYEGVSEILKGGKMQVFLNDNRIGLSHNAELLLRKEKDEGFVFCFTSIFESQLTFGMRNRIPVDDRMMTFGDSVLLIFNPQEFMNRVRNCLEVNNYEFKSQPVSYAKIEEGNSSHSIFTKPIEYSYQNEGRIFINRVEIEEFINIDIGDLKDLAIQFPLEELDKFELFPKRDSV
jgi:hypothetical protein